MNINHDSRVKFLQFLLENRLSSDAAKHLLTPDKPEITKTIVFLNPHTIALATADKALEQTILNSNYIFCDGVGIQLASAIIFRKKIYRVTGFDFFHDFTKEQIAIRKKPRAYFLGGKPDTKSDLEKTIKNNYPNLTYRIFTPPIKETFSDAEISNWAAEINKFMPDILWIGLGSPKQEKIAERIRPYTDPIIVASVGAVFDFIVNSKSNSSYFIRKIGLEWLARLAREPRRLWRRTFISVPIFLRECIKFYARKK